MFDLRLITHTDLDGIISAVLIVSVEEVLSIKFVDPATMQAGKLKIGKEDIISDLPYDKRCGLWFDHHESSEAWASEKFEGRLDSSAPSCARVVYEYYENPYLDKYKDVLAETDRIDSGKVLIDEIENPQGWFLFSNTLETSAPKKEDDDYRRHTIELIRTNPDISAVLNDRRVEERAKNVKAEFGTFKDMLIENTILIGNVAYSDLRGAKGLPRGNNYLVYSLFPKATTSVRLMPSDDENDYVKLSAGHNIYGKKSEFDIGDAMKKMGGGGHKSVGGARIKKENAEQAAKILAEKINAFEKGEGQ